MTRRSDQLDRIEASLARIETAVSVHAAHFVDQAAAVRSDLKTVQSTASAALAGTVALATVAGGTLAAGTVKVPAEPGTAGTTG